MPNKSPDELFLLLITMRCGHNCRDCFYKRVLGNQEISFRMVKEKIVPHVTKFHEINIAGGEPTLHPKFFEILKLLAKKNPLYIQVITNGVQFSNSLSQARAFAARLKNISGATGTGVVVRVSVDDFHAAKLAGKTVEMRARVRTILRAFGENPAVGLNFYVGLSKGQTEEQAIKKFGLPEKQTASAKWVKPEEIGGTVPRVLIVPRGRVFAREADFLKSGGPCLGTLRDEPLPVILRRRQLRPK